MTDLRCGSDPAYRFGFAFILRLLLSSVVLGPTMLQPPNHQRNRVVATIRIRPDSAVIGH
jgi:hypothetical protein